MTFFVTDPSDRWDRLRKERLFSWLDSPTVRKRRKAVKRLTKRVKDSEEAKQIYNKVKDLLDDEAWSVRSKVAHYLTELSLQEKDLLDETVSLLKEKATDADEHPNVRSGAIRGLSRIFQMYESRGEAAREILEQIESDHPSIELATLYMFQFILEKQEPSERLQERMMELAESTNEKIGRKSLAILAKSYDKLPNKDELETLILEKTGDTNTRIRETALSTIKELYPMRTVSERKVHITLKKRLRDDHIQVKKEALKTIFKLIEDFSPSADDFLGVITEEILLKTKNEDLLLLSLNLLRDVIEEIPTPVINRHQLPETLDRLAWNVPPNNPVRKKIKRKSRYLLEDLLGFSIEERRALRKPDNTYKR